MIINEALIPLRNSLGAVVASFHIFAPKRQSAIPALIQIDKHEAQVFGEEEIQVLEDNTYEYKLILPRSGLTLRQNAAIKHSQLSDPLVERGVINTASHTGMMPIVLQDTSGRVIATVAIEVRSAKLSYRSDYRTMLDSVASWMTDLLLELRAPSAARMISVDSTGSPSIVQQFSFLRHLLVSERFRGAIETILTNPHERTEGSHEVVRIEKIRNVRPSVARQLLTAQPRALLPETHPLAARLKSLPYRVNVERTRWTSNTPENRFVKFVLSSFLTMLGDMAAKIKKSKSLSDRRLTTEIQTLSIEIEHYLSRSFFDDLQSIDFVPMSSAVMQRRPGYRELLRFWIKFNATAALTWQGGEDVFGGGKRSVATLYEYWTFIKLLDLVCSKFNVPRTALSDLIEKTRDGFGFKLRAGKHTPIEGTFNAHKRTFAFKLSFNRTFTRLPMEGDKESESNYPAAGSWTRWMRPDCTLTLWPSECDSEEAAEHLELLTHIHFDAKYKVKNVKELFGQKDEEGEDAEGEDVESPETCKAINDDIDEELLAREPTKTVRASKREDLLKMHAYRDAIRRTDGAYILYPGTERIMWRQFHELLPGLGAFPIAPGDDKAFDALSSFIDDVIKNVASRTSQREIARHHRYSSYIEHRISATGFFPGSQFDGDLSQSQLQKDIMIMGVWCNTEDAEVEIAQKLKFKIAIETGSPFPSLLATAQYALIYGPGLNAKPGLFRISEEGPRITFEKQLLPRESDSEFSINLFSVYELKDCDPDYSSHEWLPQDLAGLGFSENPKMPSLVPLDYFLWATCGKETSSDRYWLSSKRPSP